jgi:hypothetical protein
MPLLGERQQVRQTGSFTNQRRPVIPLEISVVRGEQMSAFRERWLAPPAESVIPTAAEQNKKHDNNH